MMNYKIGFECEQLKDGKWSIIGIDYFQMEDQRKKPTDKIIEAEIKEIMDTWNQTAKPERGEYPRRLKRVASIEAIKEKVFKFEL